MAKIHTSRYIVKFRLIRAFFFAISFVMRLVILLIVLCAPLIADEEIIVYLTSQEMVTPVSIAPTQESGSGFDKSYLKALENVLRYDFNHNGKTEIVPSSKNALKLKLEIKEKKASICLALSDGVKTIEGVILSGDLTKDRKILHRAHDILFQKIYGISGIAATRILYTVRNRKSDDPTQWASDVWEADYDGANAHQVTRDGCLCVTPVFIPNGDQKNPCTHFLYVSYKIGQPKIYASAMGEAVGKRMTFLRGNQLMPAIAPTLDKIAFISDITGNPDLFIQDFSPKNGLSGKPRQVFCAPGASQGTPTFCPDGSQLAFVSNKDGTPRIYILPIPKPGTSLKELKPKMISKKTRENTCPAWSPDGKKIAYSALISGTRQIWIYDILSREELQLTDGHGHKENPSWAPNSQHLVFNSTTQTSSDLYMIHLNQKKVVKITNGPGEKRFPSWEPVSLSKESEIQRLDKIRKDINL